MVFGGGGPLLSYAIGGKNRRVLAGWLGRRPMAKALLTLSEVSVRRGMRVVIDDHSLAVEGGQCMALVGSNGAGKSTLLEAAAGLLPLEKGVVSHGERTVLDGDGRRASSSLTVGLALQKNGMIGSEIVSEHLNMACANSLASIEIGPFLEAFQLKHRANDLVAHLSQGQARKIAVLAALLPAFASEAPSLVLLDEPASGLDDDAVDTLCGWLTTLRQRGHALLVCTHDQRVLNQASHVHDVATKKTDAQTPAFDSSELATERTVARRSSPGMFGVRTHLRTMLWLNNNGMAALLTLGILLSFGSFMDGMNAAQRLGVVLAPAFAAGLCGEALVAAMREERAADWWRGVGRGVPHASWLPLVIGAGITAVSLGSLQQPIDLVHIVVGAAVCFVAWHAVRLVQLSTLRLARPQAVMVGLLTPVLILPYALLIDWLTR